MTGVPGSRTTEVTFPGGSKTVGARQQQRQWRFRYRLGETGRKLHRVPGRSRSWSKRNPAWSVRCRPISDVSVLSASVRKDLLSGHALPTGAHACLGGIVRPVLNMRWNTKQAINWQCRRTPLKMGFFCLGDSGLSRGDGSRRSVGGRRKPAQCRRPRSGSAGWGGPGRSSRWR